MRALVGLVLGVRARSYPGKRTHTSEVSKKEALILYLSV